MRAAIKALARGLATVAVLPAVASLAIRSALIGRDLAFQHSTEWLALLPGLPGQYLRRAFLAQATEGCGPDVVVGSGTTFSSARVRLDGNAYVGAQCNIGWAHVEADALVATGVHILSGPETHGSARVDVPIRDQAGAPRMVRVGQGAWIGNRAVLLADVGRHAIVGAGAVVTRPVPDYAIAVGVPARVLRDRRATSDRA